jgi:type IV pilus assembly protein PilO
MKKMPDSISGVQEKISALTLPQKLILFVVTFAVLVGAFYYFVYQEQETKIARLDSGIAEQQKKLVQLKDAAAKVEQFEKDLAASEKEFSELLALLPDQKEIPALLDSISQLGAKVGLENVLFQPQAEVPQEFYATIPIKLDLAGTYQQVATFLDSLSKMHRILKVDTLTLSRTPSTGETGILQVACTVVTYRFVEAPPPGTQPPKKK